MGAYIRTDPVGKDKIGFAIARTYFSITGLGLIDSAFNADIDFNNFVIESGGKMSSDLITKFGVKFAGKVGAKVAGNIVSAIMSELYFQYKDSQKTSTFASDLVVIGVYNGVYGSDKVVVKDNMVLLFAKPEVSIKQLTQRTSAIESLYRYKMYGEKLNDAYNSLSISEKNKINAAMDTFLKIDE